MGFLRRNKDKIIHIVLIVISISLAFGFAYLLMNYYSNSNPKLPEDPEKLGQLGDYIGGLLNPTIAGLALLWLIYSVSLQIKELKKTNEALSATLETAKQQQNQVSIQNFESLFFQLLNTKNHALNDIYSLDETNPKNEAKRYQGKDAIKFEISKFKSYLEEENWQSFYKENLLYFWGSYFRLCYQIVKLIDENPNLKSKNLEDQYKNTNLSNLQKKYFDVFRATLTQYELEAFFFNCLSVYGKDHFKGMMEDYGLFEPLLIDFDRTDEKSHRLTRYAYQYDKKIFETKNTSWNQYFKKIETIKENDYNKIKSYISLLTTDNVLKKNYYTESLNGNNILIKIEYAKQDVISNLTTIPNDIRELRDDCNAKYDFIKFNEKFKNLYRYNSINNAKRKIKSNYKKIKEKRKKLLREKIKLKKYKSLYIYNDIILIIIKYNIDFNQYCEYMNLRRTIDNPTQQS